MDNPSRSFDSNSSLARPKIEMCIDYLYGGGAYLPRK